MVRVAVASSRAVLLVGPPGTGKTELLGQIVDEVEKDPSRFGLSRANISEVWLTPEEEWTFDKVVLGETVKADDIVSAEGEFLLALRRDEWVVLDEMNRGDMDRVLGGVLTWLAGQSVKIGTWREPGQPDRAVFLEWSDQPTSDVIDTGGASPERRYRSGADWRLLGTYNAVDAARVFRMGQALSRRFKHVPVPPASGADFQKIVEARFHDQALAASLGPKLRKLYEAHNADGDTALGPALFIDIPAYIEAGLELPVGKPASTGGAAPATPAPPAAGASPEPPLEEKLLAEAYLISVGSIISKYDGDDLDELGRRITVTGVMSDASWDWVSESLHSMRA
jgi:hypothetical protein